MIYYLAGPIDYVDDEDWRNNLAKLCSIHPKICLFNPVKPYIFDHNNITIHTAKYIHDVNMEALMRSDAIVGRLMMNQSSVGTPIEFYHAYNKKPLVILSDMIQSVYIKYISKWARIVTDIDQLYAAILLFEKNKRFNAGENGYVNNDEGEW